MDNTLASLLAIVRVHPLRELCIRTHSDLGEAVWSELITLTGLRKISIWCMEGPPRVLQGWSESLGDTLTELELGVSVYSIPCYQHPSDFFPRLCAHVAVFRCPTDDPHLSAIVASQASRPMFKGSSCRHHSSNPPLSGEVAVVGHGIPGNLFLRDQIFQSRSTCTTTPSRLAAFDHPYELDGQLGPPEALGLDPRFGA